MLISRSRKLKSSTKRSRWPLLVALLFLLLTIPIIFYLNSKVKKVEATWWDAGWQYRQRVNVTNSNASSLTDFQMNFTLNTAALITAGKLQSNCIDLRVTDNQGQELPYWIEENNPGCNNTATKIWTKVPKIPTTGSVIYVYYGNAAATASVNNNGNKVFEFFDDFNGSSLNTAKWQNWFTSGTTNTYTQSAGVLQITTSACNNGFRTKNFTINDVRIRSRMIGQSDAGLLARVTDNDHLYLMRTNSGTYATDYFLRNGTSWTSLGGSYADFGSWSSYRIVEFKVVGTTLSSTVDGQAMNNLTNATFTSGGIGLRKCGGSPSFDWVVATKTAASEPGTTLATEETTPGPIVELKFDEGSGSQAKDSSGFRNNATVPGSTQWKSEAECISGKCLFFDSTGDRITMPSNQTLNNTKQLSYSFWWKPMGFHTSYAYQILRKFSGTSDANMALYYFGDYNGTLPENNGKLMMYATAGGAWKGISGTYTFTPAEMGQWAHIAFSYDSTLGGQLYVNGKPIGVRTGSGDLATNALDVILGSGTMAQYYDEFRLYPYAITQEQVLKDYNRGSAVLVGAQKQGPLSDGLVAYWKMDASGIDAEGETQIDSSGNTKTATLYGDNASGDNGTGMDCTAAGKFGSSCTFDGVDDYVSTAAFTIPSTTGRTGCAWIKPNSFTNSLAAVFRKANDMSIRIHSNGKFLDRVWNSSGTFSNEYYSTSALSTGVWSHMCVVWEGQGSNEKIKLKIYLNGQKDLDVTTNLTSTDGLVGNGNYTGRIGMDPELASRAFDGAIDEVRIYSRALSANDITALYNYAPEPLAHYKFDEGSGTTSLADSSSNNYSGTMTGFTNAAWTNGKFGKALTFSRSPATYIDLGTLFTDVKTGFSGSLWVKRSGTAMNNDPLGNKIYTGNSGGWRLLGWNDNVFSFVGSTGQVNFGTIGTNWTHLGWSYDPTTGLLTTYVNGKKANSGSVTFLPTTLNLSLGMGYGSTSQNFMGQIDDVRLYNYTRNAQQIVQDMNGGHPTGGSPIGSQLAYFPFDEGTGTAAHDTISSTYNGTLMCSGTSCAIPIWKNDGKVNKAIYFSAATGMQGDYVRSPVINMGTTLGDKLTVSAWVKPISTETNYGWIIRNGSSTDENFSLKLVSQSGGKWNVGAEYHDGTTFRNIAGTQYVVPNNVWSHISVVYSQGQNIKVYLNGQFIEQVAWLGNPSVAATTYFYVGGHIGTINQFFGGYIDEVKIYNSELTADQIKLDYNLGTTTSYGGSAVNEAASLTDGAGNPPAAEYHFEEMTGAQTADTSGNNHNGTITGAQWDPNGKESAALTFDGNDYVDVGNVGASTTNFTVSGWINPSLLSSQEISVITKRNGQAAGWALGINSNGTTPTVIWRTFNGGNQYSMTGAKLLSINTWYYVTLVHQDGTASIYINGALDRTASITNPAADTTAMRIGYLNGGAVSYKGKIDEVKVYDYIRTPAQIAYDYNRGQPVAHWRMDECQGGTIYDVGNNNDGTLVVGATGSQTAIGTCSTSGTAWGNGATGKFESSLNFDGTDDSITIPGPASELQITGAITISSWVKTTKTDFQVIVDDLGSPPYSSWTQWLDASGHVGWYDASSIWRLSSTTVNDGTWHHIVTTVDDSNNLKFYIDGKQDSNTYSGMTARTATTDAKAIGRRADANTYMFNGQLDDVRIYNYALSETQIKQVLNEGLAIKFDN